MAEILLFPRLPQIPPSSPGPNAPATDTISWSDPEARTAALDVRRSWIVEAPAGSGKTGLLIQRFLKLLALGEVQQPGEVLAITFTRKAAQELRTRVLSQLEAVAQDLPFSENPTEYEQITRTLAIEVLTRDRVSGWALLQNPQQLNIRTIDSLCGEIAGRWPLLSGAGASREPAEDASSLYEEAATRALRELGGADQTLNGAISCLLLHRDAQIADCVRLIADMLKNREQWIQLVPLNSADLTEEALDGPVRERLQRTLMSEVSRGLAGTAAMVPPALLQELASLAQDLSIEPGYGDEESPIALCHGLHAAPKPAPGDLEHWCALAVLLLTADGAWRARLASNCLGFHISKRDRKRLGELCERFKTGDQEHPGLREALHSIRALPPSRYPDDQWVVAKALFRVLRRALAELTVLFAERKLCDFTERALTARALLRPETGQADILDLPGATLKHLLVDEMQDTSSGQYELFEDLTHSWDGITQTVFLVGDPKQSIYGFRQACVERFLQTQSRGRLGDVTLSALRLTANFRSQAELVKQFNRTFQQILPVPDHATGLESDTGEVPFVCATPVRPSSFLPALHWHARVEDGADGRSTPPNLGVQEEARQIRDTIEDFVARWASAGPHGTSDREVPRIAVLARNRAHFGPIIDEFQRDHGGGPLPFKGVDIVGLKERQEVLDLLALTRALLHPGDRVAWLAVLRSPICGLGRADLLALTGEAMDEIRFATVSHLVGTRSHLLSAPGQILLQRTWGVLSDAAASLGRTSFSTHVERTWRSLGADAILGADELANTRRFFALLRQLEAQPEPLSLHRLDRALAHLYAEPSAAHSAVELMTIHRAKGLEWDLVLVPALERSSGQDQHELLRWLEIEGDSSQDAAVVLAPISGKGEEKSPLFAWLGRKQGAREAAEARRLVYVACTRAREELHLFGSYKLKRNGDLCLPAHDSLLRASWAAAEPEFRRQHTAAAHPPHWVMDKPALRAPMIAAVPSDQGLSLVASAEESSRLPLAEGAFQPLTVQRLPPEFDPLERFRADRGAGMPYLRVSALRQTAIFERPEGSFAARAFGNTVHRFLELIGNRLAEGHTPAALLAGLQGWHQRVLTRFRSEGLPPSVCGHATDRALALLEHTLDDPTGRWLLSPHPGARSERALQLADSETPHVRNMRADRVFFAGATPFSCGDNSHLWIVDFKTAEPGGRSAEAFLAQEKEKYRVQLEGYARASEPFAGDRQQIVLALFYPALPHLLYWTFDPNGASEKLEGVTDTVLV